DQWGQDHEWKQAADTVVGLEVDAKAARQAEASRKTALKDAAKATNTSTADAEVLEETALPVPSVGVTVDGMFGMRQ
ncbi:hypothetical protein ACTXO0_17390, partial [Glutamicibacter ardleyensis]|uniref:hypothetical protein n=1 Tax=Glutamicibacter ardleyensis TaxID=225894 RepID=UPI003FD2AB4F